MCVIMSAASHSREMVGDSAGDMSSPVDGFGEPWMVFGDGVAETRLGDSAAALPANHCLVDKNKKKSKARRKSDVRLTNARVGLENKPIGAVVIFF